MSPDHKPLVWLIELPKSPPLSIEARIEVGFMLRMLQSGMKLSMPHSRPMPSIGKACHELRINDEKSTWRFFYRIDQDAIVIVNWDIKKTEKTTKTMIDLCKRRLNEYDSVC